MNYINLTPWEIILRKNSGDLSLAPKKFELKTESFITRLGNDDGIFLLRNFIKKTVRFIKGRRSADNSCEEEDHRVHILEKTIFILPPYFYEAFNKRTDCYTFNKESIVCEREIQAEKIMYEVTTRLPVDHPIVLKNLIQKKISTPDIIVENC